MAMCTQCGMQMEDTQKTCPLCGAPNPNNKEVAEQASAVQAQQEQTVKSFSKKFSLLGIIAGGVLTFIGLIIFAVSLDTIFGGIMIFDILLQIGGGVSSIVFGIVGLKKRESTAKAVFISLGIAAFAFLMNIVVALPELL